MRRPRKVWEVVSDFNGLPRWLPTIESSRIVLARTAKSAAFAS